MAPHGPAGRFVGHHTEAFIPVVGDMIQGRDHAPGIIGRNDAERSICPSIQVDFTLEGSNFSILLDSHLHPHMLLVPSSTVEEHLFPGINHLHRSPDLFRGDGAYQV